MAKKKKVNMDQLAANAGDRMKHALSLEVLSRTNSWATLTYSETHAGAGVYLEKNQTKPAHIRNLRDIVLWQTMRKQFADSGGEAEGQIAAGDAYLDLLKSWWFESSNLGKYPGSAKQAVLYLTRTGNDSTFEIRLTEKDEDTYKRLKKAVSGYRQEPRQKSFYDERKWLTEPDHLLLVVDPFRCVESFDLNKATDINEGDIDHEIIRSLLTLCEKKQAAVIHFWWSKRSNPGGSEMDILVTESHDKARQLFDVWATGNPLRAVREFQDKHNHASTLIGIGDGARIVKDIPGRDQWQRSWLKPFLAESGIGNQ
ncbi:MAG: hypothetical protein MK179_22285 [Pirellulaceae bacterium]|nr:hypothetical protein [Pirellulaceae bacterium]